MSYLIPLEPQKYFSVSIDDNGFSSYIIKENIKEWSKKNNCDVNVTIITPELKKVFSTEIEKFMCDVYDELDIEDSVFIEFLNQRHFSMFKLRWET